MVAILFPLKVVFLKVWYIEAYSTVQKLNFEDTDTNIQYGTVTEFVNCINHIICKKSQKYVE